MLGRTRLPSATELDAILAVCRERGVTRIVIGGLEADLAYVAAEPSQLGAIPSRAAPTDDELLFGVKSYGLES